MGSGSLDADGDGGGGVGEVELELVFSGVGGLDAADGLLGCFAEGVLFDGRRGGGDVLGERGE